MASAPALEMHSLQSKSFTSLEITAITRLYQEIVSSPLLPPLQSAYAILPPARNGVGVVGAQPSSGSTIMVITPYGMLLLSFQDELDATSAVWLTSFIKERTEGVRDTMTVMDNPRSADNINRAETTRLGELEDTQKLLYSLREIAETSEDPESVRVAFIALTTTAQGQSYLRENPIKL